MESLEAIKQKSRSIVLDILPNATEEDLVDDRDLFTLGLDSINAMSLILTLQDAFEVEFQTCEIDFENFRAVTNIVELISTKKG